VFFPDNGSNNPHTHALIIGVGGYPHLSDGEDPNPNVVTYFGELTRLTSPPRTASRFAEWIVEHANDWDVPLGSVELLISPAANDNFSPPPNHDGTLLSLPTFNNIRQAYLAWKSRSNRNKDNIALFYFCGHGGQKDTQLYLLCQDFGAPPGDVWEGAFDFTRTRDSFHTCAAERQFFFVDACRKLTLNLLLRQPIVRGLEGARAATDVDAPFNFTQFAAPKNEAAMGPVRGISYYAQAIMRALEGAAAKRERGRWIVTTGRLVETLEEIAGTLEIPPEAEYDPHYPREILTSATILRVPLPHVSVTIYCDPEDANPLATLSLKKYRSKNPLRTQVGGPMRIEVPAGIYDATADFKAGYKHAEASFSPNPPSHHEPLDCWL